MAPMMIIAIASISAAGGRASSRANKSPMNTPPDTRIHRNPTRIGFLAKCQKVNAMPEKNIPMAMMAQLHLFSGVGALDILSVAFISTSGLTLFFTNFMLAPYNQYCNIEV